MTELAVEKAPTPMFRECFAGAHDDSGARGVDATSTNTLRVVKVGSAVYRFEEPLQLAHGWVAGTWVCCTTGFPYVGRGETPALARREWERQFHAGFQALYGKRPFEMTTEESRRWGELVSVVDVDSYRKETPLSMRQLGEVRYGHAQYPTMVRWLDGRRDRIELEAVPAELASCRPGQWIDAVVLRDPVTNRLQRITHMDKIATVHPMTNEQAAKHLDAVEPADLPKTGWDWPRD